MRILVIGKSGQLARSLAVRAEGQSDIEVVCVGRPDFDLEDVSTFVPVLSAVRPDVVINAAAHTGVDRQEDEPARAFAMNAEAPGVLAKLTAESGIPIVHVSTDYVFDGRAVRPYVETDLPNPQTVYGRSKLAGEEAVRRGNADHLIVRTAWVVSCYGSNFVKTMLKLAEARDSLQVVADQHGNPTDAHDLADGLLAAARVRRDRGRFQQSVYHLAGSGRASWFELATCVLHASEALSGPCAAVEPISSRQWPAKAERPMNSELDCEAFFRDFGFRAGAWQDRVAAIVAAIGEAKANVCGGALGS
ncbi:dTDP-4-dehydrorhamnose reductase [Aminobacter sp. HY435]|uniref:dTDP-4-dehydrorhamnose reductase n=1 Tax=Aminobacter sp. HY435 TaxID=2970917 RepID=UPI0022B9BFD8|nr:dTDP-4-dehydrorhamnose reductase [Aminobacter sp. HY435]